MRPGATVGCRQGVGMTAQQSVSAKVERVCLDSVLCPGLVVGL